MIDAPSSDPPPVLQGGRVLICDADGARVVGHCDRFGDILGPPSDALLGARSRDILGAPLRDILGATAAHALRNALSRAIGAPRPVLLADLPLGPDSSPHDVAIAADDGRAAFLIEPARPRDPQALDRLRAIADRLGQARDRAKVLQLATRLLGVLGGWDAVAVIRPGAKVETIWRRKAEWPLEEPSLAAFVEDGGQARFCADIAAPDRRMVGAEDGFAGDLARLGCANPSEPERALARALGCRAMARAPLTCAGAAWRGHLLALHRAPKALSLDERAFFELFADLCALNYFLRAN